MKYLILLAIVYCLAASPYRNSLIWLWLVTFAVAVSVGLTSRGEHGNS